MDTATYSPAFLMQAFSSLQACAWSLSKATGSLSLHAPIPAELLELSKLGRAWTQRIFPCDLVRVEEWLAAAKGRTPPAQAIEYRLISEQRGIIWVRQWLNSGTTGRRLTGLIAVISHEKHLESECLRICERERSAIGQELHDDICQLMAGLSCMLDVLGRQIAKVRPDLHVQLDELSSQIHHGMERTRVLAHGLVPAKLVNMGLGRALAELGRQTTVARQVEVRLTCAKRLPEHSAEQTLHLYRIAQEAISNAIRHGGATQIELSLKRAGRVWKLSIKDNGCGMATASDRPQGIGMHVMQFRAGILGAELKIRSSKGKGVLVEVLYACSDMPQGICPSQS